MRERGVVRALWLVLLLASCHHQLAGETVESLAGFELPLLPSPALRLAVEASFDGQPVQLKFDPSQRLSIITEGCTNGAPVIGRVLMPDAFGPDESYSLTRVSRLVVAGRRLRPFEAAFASGKSCVVVLGAPELEGLAVEVSPSTRTVRFRPSQARAAWQEELGRRGFDTLVLTVNRDPKHDWPLLPVRVTQGEATYDAPLLLSLAEPRSVLFELPARHAGLVPALESLRSAGVAPPPELAPVNGFVVDAVELGRGFGATNSVLELERGRGEHTAQGVLGADVWGRFHMAYDVREGLLVLSRPRVFLSGARARCEREGVTSAEVCFEVQSEVVDGLLAVTATVWSPLPDGVQLSLDVVGGDGSCRVGVTFPAGDRGVSTHHRFPWPKLTEVLPSCARAFEGVTGAVPGGLDEVPLQACPGVCAWAREVATGRLSCECQPGSDAHRRLYELLRLAREPEASPTELEPADPD